MLDFLEKEEAVSPALLREVETFREANPLAEGLRARIPAPRYHYYGREIWEQAIAALLCGKNLLLTGGKATGTSWPKTWPPPSAAPPGTCRSM